MGLDMYLKATKFISGYDFEEDDTKKKYAETVKVFGLNGNFKPTTPHAEICLTVAYWRKANAVHRWFVENVQEGVDECQETYCDRSKLAELLETCRKVSEDHSQAETLLPTQAGFFFGETEYDEFYFEDVNRTIQQLEYVLNETALEDASFRYRSSW